MPCAWPEFAAAVPLQEAASLLGISSGLVRELVAQGALAVCTRKPLPEGYWGALGIDAITAITQRRPFSGKTLARLTPDDARACITAGTASIRKALLEPSPADSDNSEATYSLLSSAEGTAITIDDLLVSRAEFERTAAMLSVDLSKLQLLSNSDAALGAATRQHMQSLALRPRDGSAEREAEYKRWRDCASKIQAGRLYPASKRQLAPMVKAALGLPDSDRTIRAHL